MEIKNLSKKYGDQIIVNNVSLEFKKNTITSLIGPNGAGKSTIFNIISRVIKREAGDVILEGKDISEWKNKDLALKIATLSQSNDVDMKLTVNELVNFGRFPHCGTRLQEGDHQKVKEAIDFMGLNDVKDKYIDQLSGGQRQRAYIAMIIAQDTDYIFLDEPNNNLDIFHSSNLMKTCRRLCDELNKTVILILHEINFAAKYSDYIGAFKNGVLHKYGKVEDVITKETLKEIYDVEFDIIDNNGKPVCIYY